MELRLSAKEERVVEVLRRGGAMSPSEIAVQTLMLPQETFETLARLEKSGYVVVRDAPSTPDGKLVILSSALHTALKE